MLLLSLPGFAQKVALVEGNLKALKIEKSIKVEFVYDSMVVGADLPEETFIKEKKKAWDEKEPGAGTKWERMWIDSRQKLYEPAFKSALALPSELSTDSLDSKYTLIFKTLHTEPGWSGGVIGGLAWIRAEAWIVDSNDRSKVVARMLLPVCKSKDYEGGDFEMGRRLKQAYKYSGEVLGWYIKKQKKK